MLGGPVLGAAVFLAVAVLAGWGLIELFKLQSTPIAQTTADHQSHGFDPADEYHLLRDLLLGYTSDGRLVLYPDQDDLPRHAPNRRSVPTIDQYRQSPDKHPDLLGVVEAGTRVQFLELIEDPNNRQTRILVQVRLLDGAFADKTVLGMYLEQTIHSGVDEPQNTIYVPRDDLFNALTAPSAEQAPEQAPEQADPDLPPSASDP